jgi:hypothetical protein
MKRRTFVFLTVAGAAALATPIAGCRHYSDTLVKTLGQPDFLGHICDAKTIGDIGSAYRTAMPEESHKSDLIELLLKDTPGAQDDPRLPQLLKDQVGHDFASDNTVTIKGWVLSRTEARQCAIYSFSLQ